MLILFLCRIDTDSLQVFGDCYPGTMFQENNEGKINFQRAFVQFPNNIVLHYLIIICSNLRKQPTFGDVTTDLPTKWRLIYERRNFILMTRHYPDLGSASDWLNQISHAARPIRSTTQIWVVTRHQYGISALVSQMSFSQATSVPSSCIFFYYSYRLCQENVADNDYIE